MIERLAIVGTGLMGASVGLAAKSAGVGCVAGYDADSEALGGASRRRAIDVACGSLEDALDGAEVAVVAVPVAALPTTVADVLAAAGDGCTVTDVGSTKASVCAAAGAVSRFVGGHPVCGSEASGPEHASGELFEGATWFLTPLEGTDAESYRLMHGLVTRVGATPVAIDPQAHDRLVALTSHLPHALANLLVNQAGAVSIDGHDPLAAAGGSLRDATRVAGANPRIWIDIFLDNREPLLAVLAEHRRAVARIEEALENGDADTVAAWVSEAAGNRRRVLRAAYAAEPGDLHRLRVHVTDEPGVLARVTQALGASRLNIEDFELHHLSPERGGWLGILVAGTERAERAAELLEELGYGVLVSPAAG